MPTLLEVGYMYMIVHACAWVYACTKLCECYMYYCLEAKLIDRCEGIIDFCVMTLIVAKQ